MAEAATVAAALQKVRLYVCYATEDEASGLRLGFALASWRQPRLKLPAVAATRPKLRLQFCAWGLRLNGSPRGASQMYSTRGARQAPNSSRAKRLRPCIATRASASAGGKVSGLRLGFALEPGASRRPAASARCLPPKGCSWQGGGARGGGPGTPSPCAPRQALGAAPGAPSASPTRGCANHASGAPGARFTLSAAWKQRQGRCERRSTPNEVPARC